jgi:hypothetical protein
MKESRATGSKTRFSYDSTTHSTAASRDWITDFTTGDLIALGTIDADSGTGANDMLTFIGSAAFTLGVPEQVRAFEVSGEPGHWFVEADVNGDASGSGDRSLHHRPAAARRRRLRALTKESGGSA